MEERSPGSYRLSIRGSLLRSPFGIRNIKVYLDEFPLTDAGGNTYFNLVDAGSLHRIEILKGPEGSVFGANSGGVIRVTPHQDVEHTTYSAGANVGSYGSVIQQAAVQVKQGPYRATLHEAFQRSDGYRQNSSLRRKFVSLAQQWMYRSDAQFRAYGFYSDLNYQTPGGLTISQVQADPRAARPAAGKIPGAAEQHAGVRNRTAFGGVLHEIDLKGGFKQVTALSGLRTDFENPFITNFEVRKEHSWSLRSYLSRSMKNDLRELALHLGVESQYTSSQIRNFGNRQGQRDTLQSADQLRASQQFAFAHLAGQWGSRVYLEGAASFNLFGYRYGAPSSTPLSKTFRRQVMPRLALSYRLSQHLAVRASASKGYSVPTLAEIRASDNVVNTRLEPETGWNYETGLRISNRRLFADVSLFRYALDAAIVRRLTTDDREYFVNAGGTRQWGLEAVLEADLIRPQQLGTVRRVRFQHSYTFSNFRFSNYQNAGVDLSGKRLTGVPQNTTTTAVDLRLAGGLFLFPEYRYTSRIPLNDAGTVIDGSSHLLAVRGGWIPDRKQHYEISAGADNLLNKRYSLGNDLNAVGGRYFNPAPLRNFFVSAAVRFSR